MFSFAFVAQCRAHGLVVEGEVYDGSRRHAVAATVAASRPEEIVLADGTRLIERFFGRELTKRECRRIALPILRL